MEKADFNVKSRKLTVSQCLSSFLWIPVSFQKKNCHLSSYWSRETNTFLVRIIRSLAQDYVSKDWIMIYGNSLSTRHAINHAKGRCWLLTWSSNWIFHQLRKDRMKLVISLLSWACLKIRAELKVTHLLTCRSIWSTWRALLAVPLWKHWTIVCCNTIKFETNLSDDQVRLQGHSKLKDDFKESGEEKNYSFCNLIKFPISGGIGPEKLFPSMLLEHLCTVFWWGLPIN